MPAIGIDAPKSEASLFAVYLAARSNLGQDRARDVQTLENGLRPIAALNIEKHGARRVADICDVQPAAGELPDQIAVNRAERQLASFRFFARAFDLVQQPGDFGGGEVGVRDQTSVLQVWSGRSPRP